MNNLNCMNNQTYIASGLVPLTKYKILALFGKSGAGKDTIQKWIVNHIPNTKGLISYTTRPPRENETDGKDYHFIDTNEFGMNIKAGNMIESTCFRDWYYGTHINELSSNCINVGVFNISGIEQLIADSRLEVLPVWIDAPARLRLERSFNRERNPDYTEICRRFLTDEEDFKNIPFKYEYFENSKNYGDWFNIQNIPAIKAFLEGNND